jgi:hypothetical protein
MPLIATNDLRTAEPVWSAINRAVKAGQTHPDAAQKRDALARILDVPEAPPLHRGVQKVLACLREGNRTVLRNTLATDDKNISRLLMGVLSAERMWQRYVVNRQRGAGAAVEDFSQAFAESHSAAVLVDDTFGTEAWEGYKYVSQFYGNTRDPDEMFRMAITGQKFRMTEWLRVLYLRWKSQKISPDIERNTGSKRTSAEIMDDIASHSVHAFVNATSSMSIIEFNALIGQASLPDPRRLGRNQKPWTRQDDSLYEICRDASGRPILNVTSDVRRKLPAVLTGLGCAAKHAKATSGTVIGSVSDLILEEWRSKVLPAAFENDEPTTDAHIEYLRRLDRLNV